MQGSLKREGERVSCIGKKMNTFTPSLVEKKRICLYPSLEEKNESGCLPLQAKRPPSLSLSEKKKSTALSIYEKYLAYAFGQVI